MFISFRGLLVDNRIYNVQLINVVYMWSCLISLCVCVYWHEVSVVV